MGCRWANIKGPLCAIGCVNLKETLEEWEKGREQVDTDFSFSGVA